MADTAKELLRAVDDVVGALINRAEEAHIDVIGEIWDRVDDVAATQGFELELGKTRAKAASGFYNSLRAGSTGASEIIGSLTSDHSEETMKLLRELAEYRLKWDEYDLDYIPYEATFKTGVPVISAREAALSINDGSTVFTTGFGAHARCTIFFQAVRETFEKEGGPHSLTWMSVSGQGGRGAAPGTVEELGEKGILKEYVSGHIETVKSLLKLGQKGELEIHTLPQGIYTALIEEQSKNGTAEDGRSHYQSTIGLDTFIDPRVGPGSAITEGESKYVSFADGKLSYSLPKIDVALLSVPYVDRDGNVYFKGASCITECVEAAKAAKKNGGRVFVTCGEIIEKDEDSIAISAELIDGLVFNPRHEQIAGVLMKNFWPMFTPDLSSEDDIERGLKAVKMVNTIMGITPQRRAIDNALARLAGEIFTRHVQPGALINLGIGLPEEVGRLLYESGLHKDITFTTESGTYGGIPTSGIFFGGAINPERLESSCWMFREYARNLDITVLGFLQVDSQGNVNVSRRGDKVTDCIGPGGFMDIADAASTVIFMGSWTVQGKVATRPDQVRIQRTGEAKFVDQVRQVTFSGKAALEAGKKVYYITDVGMFKLTEAGLELEAIWPGIDVEKDILNVAEAHILLPSGGPRVLEANYLSGENFALSWPAGVAPKATKSTRKEGKSAKLSLASTA